MESKVHDGLVHWPMKATPTELFSLEEERKNSSFLRTPRRARGGRRGGGVVTVTHRVWGSSDPKENFVRAPTRPRGGAERRISDGAESPK